MSWYEQPAGTRSYLSYNLKPKILFQRPFLQWRGLRNISFIRINYTEKEPSSPKLIISPFQRWFPWESCSTLKIFAEHSITKTQENRVASLTSLKISAWTQVGNKLRNSLSNHIWWWTVWATEFILIDHLLWLLRLHVNSTQEDIFAYLFI